ncbi:GNAT family N-acetyltransferase [Mangrovibacter plantisponsor]|uniref:L-amino acid N-acyltransferase YncA n=1 Tax=Mangrovibacter plantisponsor TaxID=451513 RepID=A0A317Q6X5_9ENTR|nr:GNAT family N-acetyltransferase [Mangrovibacter plantisponsor]PWW11683.1 L-amino acid N-acyltransferase YncA [Mangrovibacter plantisponsor]
MLNPVIRPAQPADVSAIENIIQGAYSHYIERIGRKPAPMNCNYQEIVNTGDVWVLTNQGEVIGLIVLHRESNYVSVGSLAIDKMYQGKGLGKKLLVHAELHARNQNVNELRLYTNEKMHENLQIYSKLGWQEYGRAEQNGYKRVFMRKILS